MGGLHEEELLTIPLSGAAMFGANFQEDCKINLNSKTPLFHDRAMQCTTFGVGGREHGALCGLHQCSLTLVLGSRVPEDCQGKACNRGRGRSIAMRWICCRIMVASSISTAGAQHIHDSCSIPTRLTDAFKQARGLCAADPTRIVQSRVKVVAISQFCFHTLRESFWGGS